MHPRPTHPRADLRGLHVQKKQGQLDPDCNHTPSFIDQKNGRKDGGKGTRHLREREVTAW